MSNLARALGGTPRDEFGLLTHDFNLKPKRLIEFVGKTYTVEELGKKINKSRISMYQPEVRLDQDFVENYLFPLVIATDLAVELIGDKEEGRKWMMAPNSYYFGRSPFSMCFLGDGKRVIDGLLEKLGREIPYVEEEARK